jgi:osmotically-inducible protein OsmY
MKRITVALVFLLLTGGAFVAQNRNSKPNDEPADKITVGRSMIDDQITAAVKHKLLETYLKDGVIDVAPDDGLATPILKDKLPTRYLRVAVIDIATNDGVVTLTGSVNPWVIGKDEAERLKALAAKQTKLVTGVREVVINDFENIQMKSGGNPTPSGPNSPTIGPKPPTNSNKAQNNFNRYIELRSSNRNN